MGGGGDARDALLQMRFHFGERDRDGPLESAVMDACARRGVWAAALVRAVEGFGAKHRLRTDRLLSLSEDAPLVAVAVGERAVIEGLVEEVRGIAAEGLIVVEGVEDGEGIRGAPEDAERDLVKVTVWGPRTGPTAPHLGTVAALRRHRVEAATVVLGVDGVLEGERRRARFVAGNRGVPAMTVGVGNRAAVEAALGEVDGAAHLVTVEGVETYSRYTRVSLHGEATRVTLVTSEVAARSRHPVYLELVHQLRREGAAGATALRGVWGYRGEGEPHGDRVLALRRDVPIVVEVVDAPDRAERWLELARSLACEDDVVYAQPVRRAITWCEKTLFAGLFGARSERKSLQQASGSLSTLGREMAEQTRMDSLFAGEPAFAPVEPVPAPEAVPAPVEATTTARVAIRDLEDGQRVRGVYAVRGRELRRKRNGEPWLRMTVGDATGTAEAVCWDDAEVRYALCGTGTPIHVSGVFETSERWGAKIKVTELRAAEDGEYELNDLAVPSEVSAERLEADLRDLLETVRNVELRELLDLFFAPDSETWNRFRDAPAAKTFHQAYRHGLLEHTLSVAQAVSAAANFFPGIDRDIAVTGALLHDIGKLLAYNDDPLAIDLTDAGRLQGEIPLGYYTVRRAIEDIPGFDPRLAQCVLHIILSHHGSLEHGSPVTPATREAVLVHMIDNLGGRLGSFDRLERQLPEGESWSGFDRALSGSAWFSERAA